MVITMTLGHLLHSSESIIEVAFTESLCIHKVTLVYTMHYLQERNTVQCMWNATDALGST